MKIVQPLWKSVWMFLIKLKTDLPYDPAIPLLGIHPKECKSKYKTDTCTFMLAALFTITNLWNQLRRPTTDGWMKKIWHIYGALFSHKEK
jgi:hypothetical protein